MIETIGYDVSGGIATLRIQREERHNALGARELEGILTALDLVAGDDEIRVLVVTGSGEKTFCAGASLDELNSGAITPDFFQRVMQRIGELPIPTLARVNGNVYGGGTELALSCDFRIGVEGTRLRVPAAAFGLCYPPAGIARFVAKLGANTSRRMLVAAEALDAAELHRIGFFDYLVNASALDERVDELTQHIAGLAPLATRAMKSIVRQTEEGGIDMQQALELAEACEQSDDLQEGFAAQKEKRMPEFSGR